MNEHLENTERTIMNSDIIREVTNDFCETYPTKDHCRGWSAMLIPTCLPKGVDPTDPRVIQIIKWCDELSVSITPKVEDKKHGRLAEATAKAIKAERIGSPAGCIAMGSVDIGTATLETGESVYITWGRNLDKSSQEWFAATSEFKPVWIGSDAGYAELIIPSDLAAKILSTVTSS